MSLDPQALLRDAAAAARGGRASEALSQLRAIADGGDPFVRQNQYVRLSRLLMPQLTDLPQLRVAFLAGSTIDPLIDLLGFWLLIAGFRLVPYNAPFDSWRQQAYDVNSALYRFVPDVVWLFITARDLRLDDPASVAPVDGDAALRDVASAAAEIVRLGKVPAIVNNLAQSADRVHGNFEQRHAPSAAQRVSQFNARLATALPAGCTVFDIEHQAACFGLRRFEDARLWFHSKHPFALDAFGPVAYAGSRLLVAMRGRSRKCVVLDLDNTLWGGVVGDDGPHGIRLGASDGAVGEAYVAFQRYLKALSMRGIALAVCSKNEETLAKEAFEQRSEMVLALSDIAVFRANWSNKADNIRAIATTLNIGLDALVFVDDNPAERALVRAELPQVAVVDMPLDPSEYVAALAAGKWFETLAISDEDLARSQAYQALAQRTQALSQTSNIEDYLRGLEMHATWGIADSAHLPRMAQLLNKTNQFQLTDRRFSETELQALTSDPTAWVGWFALRDKFGDNGLISLVVVRIDGSLASIDAWAMSCRVFSRGMEELVFQVLCRELSQRGIITLLGRYVASPKNSVVETLYERLGGQRDETLGARAWRFDLNVRRCASGIFITEHQTTRNSQDNT